MKNIFLKKISLFYVVVFLAFTIIVTYVATFEINKNKLAEADVSSSNQSVCNYKVKRLTGYNYIKPLLFVDNECESENLSSIKQSVYQLIENYKKNNVISSASIYLKSYNTNEWTSINPDEKFKPGSLLKVPELIAFLRMNEINPGLLDRQILFDRPFELSKKPEFISKSIQIGKKYTIRELLTYMIAYSDNNATLLLNTLIDVKIFKKVFTDLGLPEPDWNASDYPLTSNDFSLFMRALFNASYLNIEDSEFAYKLLSKSDFKEGILKSLPPSIKAIHKFGEAGDLVEKQLHESAVIYLDNNPYLVTIMTKGTDMKKLPEVINQISSLIYQNMNTSSKNM